MLDLSLRAIFVLVGLFTLFISLLRWLKTNVLVMTKVSIYELLGALHGVSSSCANDSMGAFNRSPPCGSVKVFKLLYLRIASLCSIGA